MVESNNSIKEYYIKLHSMYQNAINMLTAINQSLSTKASEITVNIADTDDTTSTVRIPSFLYLENKLEQLDNNFSNLFNMPDSGEAWFNKSSNMYKLEMVRANTAPEKPTFTSNNIYASLKDNTFLKDLVSPRTFLKINIDNISDRIEQMFMKKIVIYTEDLYTKLNSLNAVTYNDYVAALYNYTKGTDYEEYDSVIDLPIRKDTFESEFQIVSIPDLTDEGGTNPWTNTVSGNHSHLTYKLVLNTLSYTSVDDSTSEYNLKAGDDICLGDEMVVYKVKSVDTKNNSVIIEEVVGHVALQTYDENTSMVLHIYNSGYTDYHYAEVPLEENRFICIFLGTVRNNIRSILSDGYLVDLSTIYMKDSYGNDIVDSAGNKVDYITYYNQYCTNIGDLILGLTESAYPQLSNYTADVLSQLQTSESIKTAVSATIDAENILKVVPINKHLTNDGTSEEIISLHSQKNNINAQLSTLQDNINETYNKLINTDFSQDTTTTRSEMQTTLDRYYTQRTQMQKQLNAVIDNIASKSSTLNSMGADIKYRVRGITDVDALETLIHSTADVKCDIVGCEVEYKYKSTSADTSSLTVINSSTFTDWNRLDNIDRQRELVFNSTLQSFTLDFTEYGSTDNIIKWNQVDIPITSGEDVVIRVRYKLNVGQPFINIYTPWSDEITVIFPGEYNEDVELKTILEENNDDAVSAAFSKKLIDEGYEEHVTNKVVSSEQTFYHDADHIYSGFNTSENNLISLRTKLNEMVNDIDKYKTLIDNETNSKFAVYISVDNTEVELAQNNINKINIYNSDHITGKFIKKTMNLTIKNTGSTNVNLYSIFPGNTDIPLILSDIKSYNEQISNYERVPVFINNEISPQYLGQWIYFRQTNPYTSGDIYHNTNDQRIVDEEAATSKSNYLTFVGQAKDYINADNQQVLLGYRRRTAGAEYATSTMNGMVDIFKGMSQYVTEHSSASAADLFAYVKKGIDGLKTLDNFNDFTTSVYDDRDINFFIYANSTLYSGDYPQDATQNDYITKFEDIQGKNNAGAPIFLDDSISIVNFANEYQPINFLSDDKYCGAFLYPNLVSKNQVMTAGAEKSSTTIAVGESISIPLVFEYYLDGTTKTSVTKSIYFDLRNSLISNPVHYMIQVVGNYDMTASGDVYSNLYELADEVTQD